MNTLTCWTLYIAILRPFPSVQGLQGSVSLGVNMNRTATGVIQTLRLSLSEAPISWTLGQAGKGPHHHQGSLVGAVGLR